jgi:phosphoadenosine phosphosulfate reductase
VHVFGALIFEKHFVTQDAELCLPNLTNKNRSMYMQEVHKTDSVHTLRQKIERSHEIIEEAIQMFPEDQLCMAWTGGKDSTTMLWLYRSVCSKLGVRMPRAMFIDEGCVFEEIVALVDLVRNKWNIDVEILKNRDVSDKAEEIGSLIQVADLNERNRAELSKIGFTEDAFVFEPESFVGNHLMKTAVMNTFLIKNKIKALSTAIRWDEQTARNQEDYFSPRTDPPHTRVHPILHFTERDIWETIHEYDLPFCSLYVQGYRSLGAKGSTTKISDIPAWQQDLENTPERIGRGQDKEKIMEQLRSLGYM